MTWLARPIGIAAALALIAGCGGGSFHVHPKTEFPLVGNAHVVYSVEMPTGLGPEYERWQLIVDRSSTSRQIYRSEQHELRSLGWTLIPKGGPCDQDWVSPQDDLVRFCPARDKYVRPSPATVVRQIGLRGGVRDHGLMVAIVPRND